MLLLTGFTLMNAGKVFAAGSLVGYWNFDEQTGTTAIDSSGMTNDGTLNGNVAYSTAVLPPTTCFNNLSSLQFDGTGGSYVEVPNASSMNPTSQITIAFWMNATTLSSADYTHLLFKNQNGVLTSYGIWVDPTGHIYMETNDGSVRGLSGTSVLGTSTWHYIVATYDGTTQKLFVDGVMEAAAVLPGLTLGYQNYPLKIGNGDFNLPFNGYLDDLRIYDRGLTDQEIADLAAGGCGPDVPPAEADNGTPAPIENTDPDSTSGTSVNAPNTGLLRQNTGLPALAALTGAGLLASIIIKPLRRKLYGVQE